MFTQNKCLVKYCTNNALSNFNENGTLTDEKGYCLDHIPNPGKLKDQIYNYIKKNEKIIGLNANGLIFSDIDFSNKQFIGCNFSHCTFTNLHAENTKTHLCIFDYAFFYDCNMIHNNLLFSSYAQCTFMHTLFTSSDVVQINFNGVKSYQSSFDDSDLFCSQFIKATLVDTSFRNCNLKKCSFINSTRKNVSFKMSNTREAIFNKVGTVLETGSSQNADMLSNTENNSENVEENL